ncbi:MAG: AAA family ATPase [Clostridium sp.]|nr:AAA family ATPase [Clostridium sp.]
MNADKIKILLSKLNDKLFEREQVVALSFLTAVCGESIFFLGPPGVAKSMIALRFKDVFKDGTSFEYLMSRFSTPDEIFGPVSISRLKDEDSYERVTQGYLPDATVVFLDEIWKAGPSIQNALLTVLNEKTFRNGRKLMQLPLQLTVAASNELPAEGEGLEALWDRFLVRCMVGGIRRADLFNRMVAGENTSTCDIPSDERFTTEQLEQWRNNAQLVELPGEIFSFIHKVRSALLTFVKEPGTKGSGTPLYVSDRRWKKIVGLLRMSAFLCGSSRVRLTDMMLLLHCLWDDPSQIEPLLRLLAEVMKEVVEELIELPLLDERIRMIRAESGYSNPMSSPAGSTVFRTIKNFFYQVERSTLSRPILIYISEFEHLTETAPTHFILVDDKRKTGAQLLRLYQRSRYPSVFPKDLLEVVRTPGGIRVNDREYPLLRDNESGTPLSQETASPSVISEDTFARMKFQMEESRNRLEALRQTEQEATDRHLFLAPDQREAVSLSLRKAAISLERLEHEWKELVAARKQKL